MKQLHFFVGKGGVGKTTVSAAFAVREAMRERKGRVLLISTDPAHSLSDVFQKRLADKPVAIELSTSGRLDCWQIPSDKLFHKFLDQYKDGILSLIDKGSIFSREDIAPLLDTTLPGIAEMAALIAIRDAVASQKYSQIVVDTAPFGHTLRLFSLPTQFVRFLNFLELAASRDQVLAEHFGGKRAPETGELVERFRSMVQDIQDATSNRAKIWLVTTSEQFSLQQSLRCSQTLQEQSIAISGIVLNRIATEMACARCHAEIRKARKARTFLKKYFPKVPVRVGEDPGGPILGTSTLSAFGAHVFGGKRLNYALKPPPSKAPKFKKTSWPSVEGQLALVLGKGGVGKTTTSAALAYRTRHHNKVCVEICSVDPAPSIDEIFQADVGALAQPVFGDPGFRASELDAVSLFRAWVRELRSGIEDLTTSEVSGIHIDLSFERQLLSELLEVIPPGVDEVLAIFRIFDLVGDRSTKIIVDMAPTGHALELLRMPERMISWSRLLLKTLAAHRTLAFARDAAAKIAELSVRARELAALLKDSQSSELNVVMLPEPLPDRETERLITDLKAEKLAFKRIFVNRVLMNTSGKCRRCALARKWQNATLSAISRRHKESEIVVIRNFAEEIAGQRALKSFTGELWRLA